MISAFRRYLEARRIEKARRRYTAGWNFASGIAKTHDRYDARSMLEGYVSGARGFGDYDEFDEGIEHFLSNEYNPFPCMEAAKNRGIFK